MRRILLLGALVVLAGCVNPGAQRRAVLTSLVGQDESAIIRTLGVPLRTYDANGHRFLAYDDRRLDVIPGFYAGGGWWGPYGGGFGGFPPEVVESGCETTIEIDRARMTGWSLRGSGCG